MHNYQRPHSPFEDSAELFAEDFLAYLRRLAETTQ